MFSALCGDINIFVEVSMKKLTVFLMVVVLAVPAFAGGRSAGGSGTTGGTSVTGARGSLPIATNKPTLSVFIASGLSEITTSYNYNDNIFTKRVVDETGIQLQITSATGTDTTERLNIMLNTGDYPEIILNPTLDLEYYAGQGIIIPLDDYNPRSFPNIKRVFDEFPYVMEKITGSDGKIYAMPAVNECLHCTYANGRLWYYMPWIRDYGRKVPETLDEYTEYLRWAISSDPNKNGRRDEVGLVFSKNDVSNVVARFAKAYMPYVIGSGFNGLALDNNKKIVEQYRDPAFREALKYIAGLYKEGLVVEDSFSMTTEQETAIVRNADNIAASVGTSWINAITLAGTLRFMEYFYVPALRGPTGQRWGTNTDSWSAVYQSMVVTDKCKDPELALALYDYFNSPTVSRSIGGPKGVFWDDADPNGKGYDGQPAKWKQLVAFGAQPTNSGWHNINISSIGQAERNSMQVNGIEGMIAYINTMDKRYEPAILEEGGAYIEYMFYATSMNESKWALPTSMFIPPQNMNNADATRVADINAVLDPYKTQAWVEFITGVRDINNNSHWTAYLTELDRLGSPEMVSIRQKYVK
jgi:putative aldouronate transport system substrate-binding protein